MNRREIYFRGLGVALVALALILFISFISYNRGDYPRPNINTVNSIPANLCGTVGAHVAWLFWFFFGIGTLLLVFAIAVIGGFLIVAEPISDPLVRGLGAGLFLLAWCALASCILDPIALPGGAGGIIGHLVGVVLLKPLGIGGYVAALAALVVGALLVADAWVLWLGRKGVEMVTMHGEAPSSAGAAAENPAEATASKLSAEERIAEQKELLRKRLAERKTAPALEPEPAADSGGSFGGQACSDAAVRGADAPHPGKGAAETRPAGRPRASRSVRRTPRAGSRRRPAITACPAWRCSIRRSRPTRACPPRTLRASARCSSARSRSSASSRRSSRWTRPGHHAVRARARRRDQDRQDHRPLRRHRPRAQGAERPRRRADPRQVHRRHRSPQQHPPGRAPPRALRERHLPAQAHDASPCSSARTPAASRSSPTSRRCRTSSSPAPPAPASPSA